MEIANSRLACLAWTRSGNFGALFLMVSHCRVPQIRSDGEARAARENHRPDL